MNPKKDLKKVVLRPPDSFIDAIKQYPDKQLFISPDQNEELLSSLTGRALFDKARTIGSFLQQNFSAQEKAILILPQGLEYICGLMACFYANIIAIPTPIISMDQKEQIVEKINPILNNAEATCIITNAFFRDYLISIQAFGSISILNIEELEHNEFKIQEEKLHTPNDIAIMLYTSGSTSQPKGVMISHRNLLSQASMGATQWGITQESRIVSWMPQFHNFGLNMNLLAPLLQGAFSVILSPGSFIKNPENWLKTIAQYQATHTAAPNFAFDYCYSAIDVNAVKEISLRSIKAIICGGEPVNQQTYENFFNKFQTIGLSNRIFCPHYGMSETGTITTLTPGEMMRFLALDIPSIEEGKIQFTNQKSKSKSVTSCGRISKDVTVRIVHPETGVTCSPEQIGEIWVKSGSVGKGYYRQAEESKKSFGAVIQDTQEKGFLRTGDLGFIEDNHLFIVGREKEVIIIHGKNHHPVDIEWTIKKQIPTLTLPISVFSCEVNNEEKVVVIQEIETQLTELQYKKLVQEILIAVSENHELEIYEIDLVKNGSIPRTGSGKIQRKACKNSFLHQLLPVLYRYQHGINIKKPKLESVVGANPKILETLQKDVFQPLLNIELCRIEASESFSELGLDSIQYVRISRRIEEVFKIQFSPVMLFKHRSFEKLAEYLATQVAEEPTQSIIKNQPEAEDLVQPPNGNEKDIAIIGVSCQFPGGAVDVESFWKNLAEQKDGITTIIESRPSIVNVDCNYYDTEATFPQWGGFIEDIATFDASFFNISPVEAESMDPQQRKVLELTWSVIEDSGYNPTSFSGVNMGLFIGVHNNDYAELIARKPELMEVYGANLDSGLHMSMITHRVSRWFNFRGPSETINTACSSSFVAIHHAVESIYRGESNLAIAGGINIMLTSRVYRSSYDAGMLAADGRCKSFDKSGDGFVRAEGCGAILLKPYDQAIKDKDPIYGVIKKVVINHDGKSNSLRAPNLLAQKELIKSAYQDAGLTPDTISYIEAHGTGTPLGDPIEFQAIREAFQEINPNLPEKYCGLGTVKTNIGHCESAAGIAGLIKVLLAMKHRMLPGILHFKELNPYIELEKTPFYIVEKTKEWKRLKNTHGEELPLRAGVSSFGFGGANVHIVVEEHLPIMTGQNTTIDNDREFFIPISAKTQESLRGQIKQLRNFLQHSKMVNLIELAYVLQVGREAMEERVILLVKDIPELIQKLDAYQRADQFISGCWHGHSKQNKDLAVLFGTDEDTTDLVAKWIAKGKLEKLGQYWVQGGSIAWDLLYGDTKPHRINIPTYSFTKEYYWITENEPKTNIRLTDQTSRQNLLHPLVHQNISNLSEQRFRASFTGEEYFLKDCFVKGHQIFPGVTMLEMVLQAVIASLDPADVSSLKNNKSAVWLKDIVWDQPLEVEGKPVQIDIRLFPEKYDEIGYEISSSPSVSGNIVDEAGTLIHNQGNARLTKVTNLPTIDLKAIQSQCNHNIFNSAQIYDSLKEIGLEYGSEYQGIETIYLDSNQLLAKITLPVIFADTKEQYILHPVILDSAIQAVTRLMMEMGEIKAPLPIRLQELEIYGTLPNELWAHVRYNPKNNIKFDIDLCDEQGKIHVRMKGYSSRTWEEEENLGQISAANIKKLLLQLEWKEQLIFQRTQAVEYTKHLIILCEMGKMCTPEQLQERIRIEGVEYLAFRSQKQGIDKRFEEYTINVFEQIQTIFNEKSNDNIFIQIVYPNQSETRLFSGLGGFLKTAHLENPKVTGQVIEVEPGEDPESLANKLIDNHLFPENNYIRYQDGKRWIAGWSEIETALDENTGEVQKPWKDGGIYLITGGSGGVGSLFAKEIARETKNPIIILTGRATILSPERQDRIKEIEALGAKIIYRQADVTNSKAVQSLIQSLIDEYGGLNGIIHSAGFFRDNFIVKKTKTEIKEVLGPKVSGVIHLDTASKNLNLDFFILFSSRAAVTGNSGQADYAAANAFMDAYAEYRNHLVASGQRHGRTLSINWPFWKDGGMQVGAVIEKLWLTMGMVGMETQTGIRALYQGLICGNDQVMVVVEDIKQIHALFLDKHVESETTKTKPAQKGRRPEMKGFSIEQCLEWDFKQLINRILKIPREKIDREKNFAEYGFNSIGLTQFAIQLIRYYGIQELTPALFFKYSSIEKLIQYFMTRHHAEIKEFYLEDASEPIQIKAASTQKISVLSPTKWEHLRSRGPRFRFNLPDTSINISEPVAIIGMSGRFPGARNIEELWQILTTGQDKVEEIPLDRFDWRKYYSNSSKEPGKIISKWCGCIPGVQEFEPLFFEISPKEAETMDPRQRLLLQESWKALEDAGYGNNHLKNQKIGMYVGVEQGDYQFRVKGKGSITSNNNAILASRLAYFLNLSGPVLAINTACSSGLVAAHQAVLSLRNKECDTAIVAGVNLILTPAAYLELSQAGMLSEDGKCYAFDKRANGMVPGEAVAVLVLKRLSQAEADGDPIYAVIQGSGINYDGKTNGITAPSGASQTSLLKSIYEQSQVNPEEIEYIITHGTGTKLGDPVEINALYDTFKEYTKKQGYCALTSVKTNLGHTFAASGLVSLISMVLALRYEQIPTSLHCEQENAFISWQESPFYINKKNQSWPAMDGKNRIGAVSAFGFSGTNAHVVVRGYSQKEYIANKIGDQAPYYLLALSAKTEESLTEKIKELIEVLQTKANKEKDLAQISYTLLEGRQHFNFRCAIVTQDLENAVYILQQIGGKEKLPNLFQGKVARDFTSQKAIEQYAIEMLNISTNLCGNKTKYQENLYALADLYCQGYNLDWKQLYDNLNIQRVHLPTYPFIKENYWFSEDYRLPGEESTKGIYGYQPIQAQIHPLVHQNTSDLTEQRYSSTFTGEEIFLTDYQFKSQQIIPGVAYLEMAQAAINAATNPLMPGVVDAKNGLRLLNVSWGSLIPIGAQPVQVHISLFPVANGEIAYEIYSKTQDEMSELLVQNQGSAVFFPAIQIPTIELKEIQAQCNLKTISPGEIYEAFKGKGLQYGAFYQRIDVVYIGEGLLLAKLTLPSVDSETRDSFTLHPGIIDAALQSLIAFIPDYSQLIMPSALKELEIFNKFTPVTWIVVRQQQMVSSRGYQAGNKVTFAIDFCDEDGKIWARLKELEIQAYPQMNNLAPVVTVEPNPLDSTVQEDYQLLSFEENWQEQTLLDEPINTNSLFKPKSIICLLSDPEKQKALMKSFQTHHPSTEFIFIAQGLSYRKESQLNYEIAKADRNHFIKAFQSIQKDYSGVDIILFLWPLEDKGCKHDYSCIVHILQAITTSRLKTMRILLGATFTDDLERCYLEAWIGFERSLGMVLPNTEIGVILHSLNESNSAIIEDFADKIWSELQTPKFKSVLYQDNKRYVCQIQPSILQDGQSPVKPGETYLITGGCGGLGLLFAEHLVKSISSTGPINLILCGRSRLNTEKQSKIKVLEALGSQVLYIQADVCNPTQMKKGLQQAKERFGNIHGVIHAAGIVNNDNIFQKEFPTFQSVLDPKIKGTLVLDELLKAEPLQFTCYFSSSSAIIGDFGSCDYAIANRFLMAYARYRSQQQQKGEKSGKTIVINWPLWKDGGMEFDDDEKTKIYLKSSGQRALEAGEGLAVFDRILSQTPSTGLIQKLLITGQPSRVNRFLGLMGEEASNSTTITNKSAETTLTNRRGRCPEMKGLGLLECLEWDLKEQISQLLKISHDKLELDQNLADYGFDSINLTELASLLTNHYGIEITPSVFFGYATIRKLTEYFQNEHQEAVKEFYYENTIEYDPAKQVNPAKIADVERGFRPSPKKTRFATGSTTLNILEPIAIIGMSGRFPGARNIDELWNILAIGQDMIQEIPADRFDWREYYGEESDKTICKWCGCIPGVREFEPLFFEISPKEAEMMDPRQRLLLQESWKALEDAGYGAEEIKSRGIGMFVGVEEGDYQSLVQDKSDITSNHNAILASRLSYFLNLNGPVMAINTACSSGLVAAHQACVSLRNGECDTAIAAGVSTLLTPTPFIGMSQSGMLSADGKCFTFDKRANGLVPGEAVAAVVLKRLSQAQADGDPIYAVIKGSGINYDGKTNGITAPSGVSQIKLLKTVYDQFQVNPEEIEFIITHGTGTKLGDPVEVNALYDAFKTYTQKRNYCALTSTKTNFGHTFAPSGLVSLISLVQAIRHEIIPASLHCEQENDYINWKESPFYVNKTNRPWPAGPGKERLGGVSAFGMSGTNAHMIVQSYSEVENRAQEKAPYHLLALSAKTPGSLTQKVVELIEAFQSADHQNDDLSQISYTLMKGRQHFEYRCAVIIPDREDAIYSLKRVVGNEKLPNLFQGKVPRDFKGQKVIEEYVENQLQMVHSTGNSRERYREILYALADLYCQGYEIDWKQLYGDFKPQRIHLPTYPFIREEYWGSEGTTQLSKGLNSYSSLSVPIHPLLHQNNSTLAEELFSATFTGEEFFLQDNIIRGQRVLPSMAFLEMARAALVAANGQIMEDLNSIRLKNIVWDQPVIIGTNPVQVHIRVFPDKNQEIVYEIYTSSDGTGVTTVNSDEVITHSQGTGILNVISEVVNIDLLTIQAQCNHNTLSRTEIYGKFQKYGLNYGPAFQGIEAIYIGQGQALAKISLPALISSAQDSLMLHPNILESALQVVLTMAISTDNPQLITPISLQELDFFGYRENFGWVLIRDNQHKNNVVGLSAQSGSKFDIDFCDEQGTVWLTLRGLEMQEIKREATIEAPTEIITQNLFISTSQEPYELMTFTEGWQEETLADPFIAKASAVELKTLVCFLSNPAYQQILQEIVGDQDQQTTIVYVSQGSVCRKLDQLHYEILKTECNEYSKAFQSIAKDYGAVDAILYLWPIEDASCIEDYSITFYLLQAMGRAQLTPKRVQFAALYSNSLERCYLESWIGFERTLQFVLPNTQLTMAFQAVSGEISANPMHSLMVNLWKEIHQTKTQSVLYQDSKRYISKIQSSALQGSSRYTCKPGGTYLITGGCGGLGLMFAQHLAKQSTATEPVNLILLGRTPMDAKKQLKIKELEDVGSQVLYIQANVSNPVFLRDGLEIAKKRFGNINGLIHAAGISVDQSIFEKDIHSFQEVLEPKIMGTILLDELLKAEPLDFVCYFSSSSAVLGDFGSCDYSIANRFLMAYAHYRHQRELQGECRGKTVAINWPLWKDGGMGFGDEENTKMYLTSSGQRILEAKEGLSIFDRILTQTGAQYLVISGQPNRVNHFLGLVHNQSAISNLDASTSIDKTPIRGRGRRTEMKGLSLEQCLEWDLKYFINRLLKIPRDKIDRQKNLAEFGFNSLGLTQLAIQLIKHYKMNEITPALFFRYSSIEKLIQYFVVKHSAIIEEFYQQDDGSPISIEPAGILKVSKVSVTTKRQSHGRFRFTQGNTSTNLLEPIAIIGMSGRFPGARNVDELWQIMVNGQDVVQEIPAERFDWREYFGDPTREPGKMNSKWCGCIPGIKEFEPLFFEISPREAEMMDPRQRLLLQEAWKALEDAGYGQEHLRTQRIGMFVGAEQGDYQLLSKNEGNITANHNAILASRLAYFLNLSGPVLAIDTACSSGLVAAHEAVLSLRNNECDSAIAAGVNLMLTPVPYIGMSQAGMLSPDGKCYAFDTRANGMVPGEAVAVLVFKRLSQAIKDGDPIYAVIKGSGINYDGKTNGITAPNGVSQTNLLKTVYEQHGVNPEEIEYIVTHGTGTKLGDPVEINALYDAFKVYTNKQNYCALTSTKTNFGHAFAASGLVSLISLVQALRYETIPASLNCIQENDYINWKESPFYVNKTNKSWPVGSSKIRTGAVSSFGMSGTNAHMVVQNYNPGDGEEIYYDWAPYYLLTLSAKTEESLSEKIKALLSVLQDRNLQLNDLSPVSYTLMVGRHHFQYRCAIVIQDQEDAVYVLKQVGGKEKLPNLFQGKVPRDFLGQKAIAQYIEDLLNQSRSVRLNRSKYQEILFALAELYCQGYEIEWSRLFGEIKPSKIHLPTYPFTREHYWVSDQSNQPSVVVKASIPLIQSLIHPLLHHNTSNLLEQRFSSCFTGEEFFLKDHVILGQRVLPGVAYLEMARAAVEMATCTLERPTKNGLNGMQLQNIVWARPIVVNNQPAHIHIGIFPEENDEISYEIYSLPESATEAEDTEPIIYCQGRVLFDRLTEAPSINLQVLQAQCNQNIVTPEQVYNIFKMMGIDYGPGHRGIEKVYVGQGQVLAKLILPVSLRDTKNQYELHPSIMDAALQAAISLDMSNGNHFNHIKPVMPFALQELNIYSGCTSSMWVFVRASVEAVKLPDKIQKLDIDLCDEAGKVCVRMKGYSSRTLEGEVTTLTTPANVGTLLLTPCWKEKMSEPEAPISDYAEHLVILCALEESSVFQQFPPIEILGNELKDIAVTNRCLRLQIKHSGLENRFQTYATQMFEEIQNIFIHKPKGKVLFQVLISSREEESLFMGLSGLIKTARLENPNFIGQLIEIDSTEEQPGIIAKIRENSYCLTDDQIRYRNGVRYVTSWSEIQLSKDRERTINRTPWKDQGVYLISGGAGGLGFIIASEIVQKVKKVTLILTGRSALSQAKQAQLKLLQDLGATVAYQQIDIANQQAVGLIESIKAQYGGLSGIIHCAGIVRDNYIIKKNRMEFLEVLAPKVSGLVHLDEASKELNLDFFLLFSSITGVIGNPGQADYSTANAFLDAFAYYRNRLVESKQRHGLTLSINWPLWKDGGMKIDREIEQLMTENTGMIPMGTQTGIQALYKAFNLELEQVMVLEGDLIQLREKFLKIDWKETESNEQIPTFDDSFYQDLIAKISNHELSESQIEKLIHARLGGQNE